MNQWIIFSFATIILWGLWGFFAKLASLHIQPKAVYIYELLGALIVGIVVLAVGVKPETNVQGMFWGVLTGIVMGLGHFSFFYAASKGKVSIVTTLTALYPLVTLILAVLILREVITIREGAGVFFALIAVGLLST